MRVTQLLRASHYQPMIKFLGQRSKLEYGAHAPAPHPAAPQEVQQSFQTFLAKLQSSSGGADNPSSTPKGQSTEQSARGHTGGREAENSRGSGSSSPSTSSSSSSPSSSSTATSPPSSSSTSTGKKPDYENFWEAPEYLWQTKELSEREMEAIMSGGATDIRTGA